MVITATLEDGGLLVAGTGFIPREDKQAYANGSLNPDSLDAPTLLHILVTMPNGATFGSSVGVDPDGSFTQRVDMAGSPAGDYDVVVRQVLGETVLTEATFTLGE